jgi:hypothetical protein
MRTTAITCENPAALPEDREAVLREYLIRAQQELLYRLRRAVGSEIPPDDLEDHSIALTFDDGLRSVDLTVRGSERILILSLRSRFERALQAREVPIYDLEGWMRSRTTYILRAYLEAVGDWGRRGQWEPLPSADELPDSGEAAA